MEYICPFCGHSQVRYKRRTISPYNMKEYTLLACNSCNLEYFVPLVFENVYENELVSEYGDLHGGRAVFPPWTRELVRVAKSLHIDWTGKKILEVGAGDGTNFTALREVWRIQPEDYYAIELDAKSADVCRKRGIENVRVAKFDRSIRQSLDWKFDLILLLEVAEHQTDPGTFFDLLFDVLAPHGMIILTVPNRERFFARQMEFEGDVPPHHFLKFNLKFFQHNFSDRLIYGRAFTHRFTVQDKRGATRKIQRQLRLPNQLLFLVALLVPLFTWVLRVLGGIRGEGLFVILVGAVDEKS